MGHHKELKPLQYRRNQEINDLRFRRTMKKAGLYAEMQQLHPAPEDQLVQPAERARKEQSLSTEDQARLRVLREREEAVLTQLGDEIESLQNSWNKEVNDLRTRHDKEQSVLRDRQNKEQSALKARRDALGSPEPETKVP